MGHKESILPALASGSQGLQLVAAPAIMIVLAGLQTLKAKAGKSQSELYQHIWKFLSKAEARDKTGRIVQYFCRFLQGLILHMPSSALAPWKPVIAELQTTLAWARRTHRWGKEMPHIPVLGQALADGDLLEMAQRSTLITFLIQDHIYFLLKVGILKFQNYTAVQWHRRNLRFITFSHVLNFSLAFREILRIKGKQQLKDSKYICSQESEDKAAKAIYENKRMMFRYVLTFIQMLSVSGVKAMDDTYIGLMGVVSSYIDASKQW